MTPETLVSVKADRTTDVTLHEEITRRAYELCELRRQIGEHGLECGLQAELPRVLYAAAELGKYAKGQARDIGPRRCTSESPSAPLPSSHRAWEGGSRSVSAPPRCR